LTDEFSLDEFAWKQEGPSLPELIMLYGPYGQGKTHLALSASEVEGLYPMAVLDLEGSTTGVIDKFDRDRVTVIRPKENPAWKGTKAQRNGRIYVSTDNSLLQAWETAATSIADVQTKYLKNR